MSHLTEKYEERYRSLHRLDGDTAGNKYEPISHYPAPNTVAFCCPSCGGGLTIGLRGRATDTVTADPVDAEYQGKVAEETLKLELMCTDSACGTIHFLQIDQMESGQILLTAPNLFNVAVSEEDRRNSQDSSRALKRAHPSRRFSHFSFLVPEYFGAIPVTFSRGSRALTLSLLRTLAEAFDHDAVSVLICELVDKPEELPNAMSLLQMHVAIESYDDMMHSIVGLDRWDYTLDQVFQAVADYLANGGCSTHTLEARRSQEGENG